MWQRARFLEPTPHKEPFWVVVEHPLHRSLPALNDDGTGFEDERIESDWYRTNVLASSGTFCLYAPHCGVELLAEFAEDVELDRKYVR